MSRYLDESWMKDPRNFTLISRIAVVETAWNMKLIMMHDLTEDESALQKIDDIVEEYFAPTEYGVDWLANIHPDGPPEPPAEPMYYDPKDVSWVEENCIPGHEELFLAMYNGVTARLLKRMSKKDLNTELTRMCRERVLLAIYCLHALNTSYAVIKTAEKLDKKFRVDTVVFKVLAIVSIVFGVYKLCSRL